MSHDRHHEHEKCACSCECGHEHVHSGKESYRGVWIQLGIGAALFGTGLVLGNWYSMVAFFCQVIAYVILGIEVLFHAGKNMIKGKLFDENFLMCIATLAAFAIGEYAEATAVMLFFQVGELCEELAASRSRSRIMEAVDMRPEVVSRMVGESIEVIPAKEAREGDVILVKPGDRIPLDGVIVQGEGRIDTAAVTGESVPITVEEGSNVVSGCMNVGGILQIRVEKELQDSMVSRILHAVEEATESKPRIDRFITKFSKIYTPFVVALALATGILPSIFTGEWRTWIYTAITFMVISCPCALVLSVPLAFFSGIGRAAKQGILFKGGLSLEALRKIKVAALDKTGTLTYGSVMEKKVVNDSIKPEARQAIRRLKRMGLRTVMLTGDVEETAREIARETEVETYFARLHPDEKFVKMKEIRERYGAVLFVGDGINDAPVLAGADVGAAMGSGADAAIEAADVVFMTSSMEAVPDAIQIAKRTNRIAIQNVVFALGIKALVMILGFCGFANMWMAVFADTGVAMLCVLNSVRILYKK